MVATNIELVRTLIPDTDAVFGENGDQYIFEDAQIDNFITVGGNVLRAAALACMAVGSSEAIISKIIRTQDLQTNGAQLQESFTNKAKVLFGRADAEEAKLGIDSFEIIDFREGWYPNRVELTEYGTIYGC